MKRLVLTGLFAGVVLLAQGCNTLGGQPQFAESGISPDQLKPGDEALITVKLKDKHQVVQGIEGVVEEDQRITFDLNDRGEQADKEAGDSVWTFGVKVPFQAPEGKFTLNLTAYRADGNPVSIRDKEGNVNALGSTVPLIISVPAPEAPVQEGVAEASPTETSPAETSPETTSPEESKDASHAAPADEKSGASAKSVGHRKAKPAEEPAPEAAAPEQSAPEAPAADGAAPVEEAQPIQEAAPAE